MSQNTQQQGPESERRRPRPDQQQGNSDQFGQAGEPGLPPEDDQGWRPEERGEREQQAEKAASNQQAGGRSSEPDAATSAPDGQKEQVRGRGF